jgi:hypothetical protein
MDARAQDGTLDAGVPFYSTGSGSTRLGTTPLRIWHRTRGYAQEESDTAIGTRWATDIGTGIAFIDGQFRMSNSADVGVDIGGGLRWRHSSLLSGEPRVFGVSAWYDGQETNLKNYFNQVGVSLESLGQMVDVRLNANFPTEDVQQGEAFVTTEDVSFTGNQLSQTTLIPSDLGLRNVDVEMALRIPNTNAWIYTGGYALDGEGFSTEGYKVGGRGYVMNDLAVDVGIANDSEFGTNTVFQVIWTPGRTTPGASFCLHGVGDRLREPVYRNNYIATRQQVTTGTLALTDTLGNELNIVHVDSTASAPGDGTFESPLASLNDVLAISEPGDIVLVHSGSSHAGQAVSLQDAQRLLGEGGGESHTVTTSQLGSVTIPETRSGAATGPVPIISGAPGTAILLAGGTDQVSTLAGMEVSNLSIDGGTRGIASASTGVGGVNINRVSIANTSGNGIELEPLVETSANGSQRVRFEPTISQVTFDSVGGDDMILRVDSAAATAVPAGTARVETIAVSEVTSTGSGGLGLHVSGNRSAATIADFSYDGGATGQGGLLLTDSTGAVTMSRATIRESTGAGVEIRDSTATHTLTNVDIKDTGGAGVLVDGSTAGLNFTGLVTQTNGGSAVEVTGGHTGTLTFSEATTDAGVIDVRSGDGLTFDNADGVYTFNHKVNIGGAAVNRGINVVNSDAVLTFADAEITNTSGNALTFDGGDASMTLTGKVTQNTGAVALAVSNGHNGTLVFNELDADDGIFEVSAGNGLQFNNADGAYTFNHAVVLNGGNAGIDILNDSEGTFTFDNTTITDPTGEAFVVDGGTAIVTFTGKITQSRDALAVAVRGRHSGDISFNEFDAGDGVIDATHGDGLLFDDADGTYAFNHAVVLDGTSNATDTRLRILNDSDGSITFADAQIVDPTATAVEVVGGDADLNFVGRITQSNNQSAVSVTGAHTGTLNFTESTSGAGVIEATAGNGLQFSNADGSYNFTDAVELSGSEGINIQNSSSGTFTFATDSVIDNVAGTGLNVQNSTANVIYSGEIRNNSDALQRSLVIDGNSGGTVSVNGGITDTGEGILVQNNTGGSFRISGQADLDTGANDAVTILNNSNSNTRFDNLQINTTSGDGFVATNSDTIELTGNANTIETTTGIALNLNDVEVGGLSANFRSITANGGANGAIVLNDVRGSFVTVGANGSSAGDGGSIMNMTGDAVRITNVANASLNNLLVDGVNTGLVNAVLSGDGVNIVHNNAAASNVSINGSVIRGTAETGINFNASGNGAARLTANGNTIDNTGSQGINLNVSGTASLANITIDGNTVVNTSNNEALLLVGSGATSKTINVLIQNNSLANDDPTAVAADLQANGAVRLNATVLNNVFTNDNAASGRPMEVSANAAGASVRLSMFDNQSTSAVPAGDDYFLIQTAGSFGLENRTVPAVPPDQVPELTAEEANEGTINETGTINTDPGNIPRP